MARAENGPGRRPGLWTLVLVGVRPLVTVVLLVVAYYLLPLDHPNNGDLWFLVIGLVAVGVLLAWNIGRIMRSRHPTAQGIQTLALVIPLYLLIFSAAYVLVGEHRPASFNAPLTRTDALYFAVTVFTTVGFGDITPVTQSARVLVTFQMVGDLLVLGVVLQVVVAAVKRARAASPDIPRLDATPHPARTIPPTAAADSVGTPSDEPTGGNS